MRPPAGGSGGGRPPPARAPRVRRHPGPTPGPQPNPRGEAPVMIDPTLISVLVGVGVILLMGGAGLVLSRTIGSVAEERLEGLSGPARAKDKADPVAGMLMRPQAI